MKKHHKRHDGHTYIVMSAWEHVTGGAVEAVVMLPALDNVDHLFLLSLVVAVSLNEHVHYPHKAATGCQM